MTFTQTPALDVRIWAVGAFWDENGTLLNPPTSADVEDLVQEIEATYPIPKLQWDGPYHLEEIDNYLAQDPVYLAIALGTIRSLDGCINLFSLGCQRIYVGAILADPPLRQLSLDLNWVS